MDKEQKGRYEYAKSYLDKAEAEISKSAETAEEGEYERLLAESYALLAMIAAGLDISDPEAQ